MDQLGISHQVVYPNVGGFGNQRFLKIEDRDLRIACVEIYNDYMADVQARSGGIIRRNVFTKCVNSLNFGPATTPVPFAKMLSRTSRC